VRSASFGEVYGNAEIYVLAFFGFGKGLLANPGSLLTDKELLNCAKANFGYDGA
jgi:hypothetical protein